MNPQTGLFASCASLCNAQLLVGKGNANDVLDVQVTPHLHLMLKLRQLDDLIAITNHADCRRASRHILFWQAAGSNSP